MNFLDTSVQYALGASLIIGRTNSYLSNNPKEAPAVIAYLKGGRRPTTVMTAMGHHLVSLEDARRAGYAAPKVSLPDPEDYNQEQFGAGPYGR